MINIATLDFIDTESDSSSESSSEHNGNLKTYTIDDILTHMKKYISAQACFKNMTMIVDVTDVRKFKTMTFVSIKDATNNMRSIIYDTSCNFGAGDKLKIVCSLFLFKSEVEIIIHSHSKVGAGNSAAEFEALKKQLQELGCFDRKPVLENNYTNIGVVSSMSAAGMKDFMHTLNERCNGKKIYLYPAIMQGNSAPRDVSRAIQLANNHNVCDVIVVIRGGGSKDDLECFNAKTMVMAIFQSKIPVITGIGHQIDISLADMASCKSYITPTAVAQNITLENVGAAVKIAKLVTSINKKICAYVNTYSDFIKSKRNKLFKYSEQLMEELNDSIVYYRRVCDKNRSKLLENLNGTSEYIVASKETINKYAKKNYCHIRGILDAALNNMWKLSDAYERQLVIYEEYIKNVTRPKLISLKTGAEITTLAALEENKSYVIQFIDGSVII